MHALGAGRLLHHNNQLKPKVDAGYVPNESLKVLVPWKTEKFFAHRSDADFTPIYYEYTQEPFASKVMRKLNLHDPALGLDTPRCCRT